MDEEARVDIERTLLAYLDTLNNADWDGFRRYLADGATAFSPWAAFAGRATGRAAVEAAFQPAFARWRATLPGPPYLHITPDDLAIQIAGDIAIVTFHTHEDAELGRRTLVWRKDADGWKVIHLHASYLTPTTE